MRVDYLAHSCFLLTHRGFRVLFDPYSPQIGYPAPRVYSQDLIVISHDHSDHNALDAVSGSATVVRGIASRTYGPLKLSGSIGWHGLEESAEPVSLTLLEWDGLRLAHFGDIGRPLDGEQEKMFSQLDLLLLPCGGHYTIDGPQAAQMVKKLQPKVVVPMHYMTPFLDRVRFQKLENADRFISSCKSFASVRVERSGWAELQEVWSGAGGDKITLLYLQHQMS